MTIDLTTLAADKVPVSADIPAAALEVPSDDFVVADALHVEGTVERVDGSSYRLDARVTGTLSLSCARCAEPFDFPVDAAFELRFVPATPEEAQARTAAHADDDEDGVQIDEDASVVAYDEPVIDLAQVVREQAYLALPMKPLCRPDCKGLCPQCGTNWNQAACNCENRWEDPRLAGLKSLLKDAD